MIRVTWERGTGGMLQYNTFACSIPDKDCVTFFRTVEDGERHVNGMLIRRQFIICIEDL